MIIGSELRTTSGYMASLYLAQILRYRSGLQMPVGRYRKLLKSEHTKQTARNPELKELKRD